MVIPFRNLQQFSRETRYRGWDALTVERGDLALTFVPQVGGRVMGLAYKGKDLFFTDPAHEGKTAPEVPQAPRVSDTAPKVHQVSDTDPAVLTDLARIKREHGLKLYGGSKTWLSPQGRWPGDLPFYDLDSGAWELTQSSSRTEVVVVLTSRACRESGAKIRKEFAITEGGIVRIHETIENTSKKPIQHGLWHVTQLDRPGTVFAPLNPTSRFGDGVKTFLEETPDPSSAHQKIKAHENFARVECDSDIRFKFGTDSDAGWIIAFLPWEKSRWIVFKKRFQILPGAPFGHDCSVEIFNSNETPNFEIEIHSPVVTLAPGQTFQWESSWHFSEASRLPVGANDLSLFIH